MMPQKPYTVLVLCFDQPTFAILEEMEAVAVRDGHLRAGDKDNFSRIICASLEAASRVLGIETVDLSDDEPEGGNGQ
jgi:hypothetical protein